MDIDPRSLRKASQQQISLPDWLPDSINQFVVHPQLGKVKILGYLATTVRVEKGGKNYQVEVDTLHPITEQSTLDLSQISTPLYQQLGQLWSENINSIKILPETAAAYESIPSTLHSSIKNALLKQGIQQLYRHQTHAIAALEQEKSLIITTPTGSGKSLCFSLPAFNEVIKQNKTVLLIYPLKALINDQYQKLTQFNQLLPPKQRVKIARCTGDVAKSERDRLWKSEISPDVLHFLLAHAKDPYYQGFASFLARLSLIVCDEAHSYISAFGLNLCNLLRRLKLAAYHYQSVPNWVISTATLGNPLEFAQNLTGLPLDKLQLIAESGAKTYERNLFIFETDYKPNLQAVALAADLLSYGLKGLIFVNSRLTAKFLHKYLINRGFGSITDVFYGSLPDKKRRSLTDKLDRGELKALVSTSALQAGIDLDSVDFVLIRGINSLNDFRQRGGRCGRNCPGLVLFVGDRQNLIDDYYANRPDELVNNIENVKLNPSYPPILAKHLLCAAKDVGIPSDSITQFFGQSSDLLANELMKQNKLQ